MDSEKQQLWPFACGVYEFGDVKGQCLELQDVYGANVDVILWLAWLHSRRCFLSKEILPHALAIVGGVSQDLLKGLRDLRSKLTSSSNFTRVQEQLVRKHILAAELAIEKISLQRLQDLTACQTPIGSALDALNLFDYLDSLGLQEADEIAADLLAASRGYWLMQEDEQAVIEA